VSCFEHFRDAQQALDECFRVLKPGGRLAISVDSLLPQNSRAEFRSWHSKKYFVTEILRRAAPHKHVHASGLRPGREPITHLLNSERSARIRELFLRNPIRWLPAFPALYSIVLYFDSRKPNMPGQVLVATAFKLQFQIRKHSRDVQATLPKRFRLSAREFSLVKLVTGIAHSCCSGTTLQVPLSHVFGIAGDFLPASGLKPVGTQTWSEMARPLLECVWRT